ncbi:transposase [Thioploca ingrica]|uniref:Transposase n=1 Tax=Thioploca ingrica TaxID=40754 RepID=A0A090AJ27_9GAMM|nr:transposase [Thioploca ingrica]
MFPDQMKTYQRANKVIVYLDESGFVEDMPRRQGYALVRKRGVGKHNWHARGRPNVIGALLASRLLTVSLFSSSINANTFYAWIAPELLPTLPPNEVIVMDDALTSCREYRIFHYNFSLQETCRKPQISMRSVRCTPSKTFQINFGSVRLM